MTTPKLLYYKILEFHSGNLTTLKQHFNLIERFDPLQEDDQLLSSVDAILHPSGYDFDRKKIDKCKKLKIIGHIGEGHSRFDAEYAQQKGISIITPDDIRKNTHSISSIYAEFAWRMIVSLLNQIVISSSPSSDNCSNLPGHEFRPLSSMQLGVVGMGEIGLLVAQLGLNFGMDVAGYDPYISSGYPGINFKNSIDELVSQSDVVTIHLPHSVENMGLFDEKRFSLFKDGAYLVNASQKDVLHESSLLRRLKEGKISGAALVVPADDYEDGIASKKGKHPLWLYANVNKNLIIVPPIPTHLVEKQELVEKQIAQKMIESIKENRGLKIIEEDVWAIIPARGGSKSIPLKNMVSLNGKPLIDYSINAGMASHEISRIICSSDHDGILQHCKKAGIDTQKRPDELSGDNVSTLDVLIYFLNTTLKKEGQLPEYLVLLEPTSPFLKPSHINECIRLIKSDSDADSVQTVTMVEPNSHAYNQRYHDNQGSHFLFVRERKKAFNKQLKPQFYKHGNVRIMRVSSLLNNKDIFGNKSLPVVIPRIFSLDLDGPEDMLLAESVLSSGVIDKIS